MSAKYLWQAVSDCGAVRSGKASLITEAVQGLLDSHEDMIRTGEACPEDPVARFVLYQIVVIDE